MKVLKFFYVLSLLLFFSCDNYLDIVPDNVATLEYAFRDRVRAEKYLFTCYSYLPKHGTADDPGLAADEIWSNRQRSGNFPNRGFDLMYNGNDVNNPFLNFWDGSVGGTALWQGIRDCNIFLENVDHVRNLDDYDKARWKAEVKFLKAYYHYFLLGLYGPIPIVRENLPIASAADEVSAYREPTDEVFNYVIELIDEAVPDLPLVIDNRVAEIGRITKAIALSIKAKVLVTAASPLFNGNTDYTALVDNRGRQLFNNVPDPQKWTLALRACEDAIKVCHEAGLSLYHFTNNALGLSEETKQILTVSQVVTDKWNNETIWGWASNNQFHSSRYVEQFTIAPLAPDHRVFSGGGTWAPTMKMAELFYTENGVPIDEDINYPYNSRYEITTVPASEGYYMQPDYQTAVLHLHREPRFYGNIGVDGGWWYGLGRFKENEQWPIQSRLGSTSGKQGIERFSPTSFYLKKMYNYESVYSQTTYIEKRWNFPIFRLADLYLLYAETLNETLESPSADVYYYVNLIRSRAGLKSVEESWSSFSQFPQKYLSKSGMRDIIHRERNIELAFEGHRFWDMRRWKEAPQEFSKPVRGWNINGATPEEFYQVTILRSINYNVRDVFWPIRQSNLSVNTNLIQNLGW